MTTLYGPLEAPVKPRCRIPRTGARRGVRIATREGMFVGGGG